jgi:ATPase subunit of ABC transporter with duplicated ATPase domains
MHKPIQFKNISLEFPNKSCFKDFSAQINYGDNIAIIGRNGSGKSSLFKILQKIISPTDGFIIIPEEIIIGYVPQIIEENHRCINLSGGQRFNKALTEAISGSPNVLLLDEPTNHLDLSNKKSLLRMLFNYTGTLIVVSHDVELLTNNINTLWHINNNAIEIFSGNYNDYMREIKLKRESLNQEVYNLKRQKKDIHNNLMQEQHRAKNSRLHGEKSIDQKKWPTIVSKAKARRSEETTGSKKTNINNKKQELLNKLDQLYSPEIIKPNFTLASKKIYNNTIASISEGSVGYNQKTIVTNISLSIAGNARIAIMGDNGGGEKARLALAQIAAKTPNLLILDEIANNLDLETRDHVIQVLLEYPGAMIVISHDQDFLKAIDIKDIYSVCLKKFNKRL